MAALCIPRVCLNVSHFFITRILSSKLRPRQLEPARQPVERPFAYGLARSEPRSADRRLVQSCEGGNVGIFDSSEPVDVLEIRRRFCTVVYSQGLSIVRGRTDATECRRLRIHEGKPRLTTNPSFAQKPNPVKLAF